MCQKRKLYNFRNFLYPKKINYIIHSVKTFLEAIQASKWPFSISHFFYSLCWQLDEILKVIEVAKRRWGPFDARTIPWKVFTERNFSLKAMLQNLTQFRRESEFIQASWNSKNSFEWKLIRPFFVLMVTSCKRWCFKIRTIFAIQLQVFKLLKFWKFSRFVFSFRERVKNLNEKWYAIIRIRTR